MNPLSWKSDKAALEIAFEVCTALRSELMQEYRIEYSFFESPFGLCLVASIWEGICNVLFAEDRISGLTELASRWKRATFAEHTREIHRVVEVYVTTGKSDQCLALSLSGTDFELQVWQTLLAIPSGQSSTYSIIAQEIGRPAAIRAIATAIGKNLIAYLIPCHRVVRSNGELGGYHWGVERKKAMLARELSIPSILAS